MRNPISFRKRTTFPLRFRPVARLRRLFAGAAIVTSLVFGAGVLAAAPALAVDVGSSGLSVAFGHTCVSVASIANDETSYDSFGTAQAVFCIELGIYTSAATGASSVVAQVEGICQLNGVQTACESATGDAAAYTPAYSAAGQSIATGFGCDGNCKAPRTFFYPIVTTNTADNVDNLDIYDGVCLNNVWAVLFYSGTDIQLPDYHNTVLLMNRPNLATAHFKVCMSSSGAPSWTQLN